MESAFPVNTNKQGMTLRDYFAAKALAGLCVTEQPFGPKEVAQRAYLIADAMLEARKTT